MNYMILFGLFAEIIYEQQNVNNPQISLFLPQNEKYEAGIRNKQPT